MSFDKEPVSILYSTHSPDLLVPQRLHVNLSSKNNRRKLPDEQEQDIQTTWTARREHNPTLFNGTKFRLECLQEFEGDLLSLNLGVTCYKDFQGTNLSENALLLQSQGLCDHDNSQAYMSDAVGVGALVQTLDDHMVILFRSEKCGEDTGLWDRPGGHPEPKKIVGRVKMKDIDVDKMPSDAVVREIYHSITAEVVEEVNIPESKMDEPRILGICRNNLTAGKPNIEFLIRCYLTSKEVELIYKKGDQKEAFESERIRLLPLDEALSAHVNNPVLWNKMAPGVKGLIMLYNMYKHRFLK